MICLLTQINENSIFEEHLSYLIVFFVILEKKSDKIILNVYYITGYKIMVQEF